MAVKKTIIIKGKQVEQKINRIAYELYENNFSEKQLVLVGILPQGYILADKLSNILKQITACKIELVSLQLDKKNPLSKPVKISKELSFFKNKNIVLVDDVLNTGKTLMHAAAYLTSADVKKLSTVCLVDRMHRSFPIRADIVGLTLTTTLQEHILVDFNKKNSIVYLQ